MTKYLLTPKWLWLREATLCALLRCFTIANDVIKLIKQLVPKTWVTALAHQ